MRKSELGRDLRFEVSVVFLFRGGVGSGSLRFSFSLEFGVLKL